MSKHCVDDFPPGALVRARSALWSVSHVVDGDRCRALWLTGVDHENRSLTRTLVVPFDKVDVAARNRRPRVVRTRQWMHTLRRLVRAALPIDVVRSAALRTLDLLSYQLEPVAAIISGVATRIVIADEVGLGKTIQAGFILKELSERGDATRSLIVVPAGLRHQWQNELVGRFTLDPQIADAEWLRRRVQALPANVNPWSLPGALIVSSDFIKRPEVLNGIESTVWDVLIVDEAHHAAGGSDRATAIHGLAARSRYVVLLSATPHSGNESHFVELCRVGRLNSVDDRPLFFRRTRETLGSRKRRRVSFLRVRLTEAEYRVLALLERYVQQVEQESTGEASPARLAMTVLGKRALSSAQSLERSLRRRLAWLSTPDIPAENHPVERRLPFDDHERANELDDGEPDELLRAPGLESRARERAWLAALAEVAHNAAKNERKISVLERLLRRIQEPVIVFTEYRDTLSRLARALSGTSIGLLHGACTTRERTDVMEAFANGRIDVLLATDAAAEGLNLQARCRTVINFELPWSPTRLAQRSGRVDRIGQARPVHALHLVARHTAEEEILARLNTRFGHIKRTFDAVATLSHHERATGRPITADPSPLGFPESDTALDHDELRAPPPSVKDVVARTLMAVGQHRALRASRAVTGSECDLDETIRESRLPLLWNLPKNSRPRLVESLSHSHPIHRGLGSGLILIYRTRVGASTGRVVQTFITPLWVPCPVDPGRAPAQLRALLARVLEAGGPEMEKLVSKRTDLHIATLETFRRSARALLSEREQAIIRSLTPLAAKLLQPGLFDPDPAFARAAHDQPPTSPVFTDFLRHWESTSAGNRAALRPVIDLVLVLAVAR